MSNGSAGNGASSVFSNAQSWPTLVARLPTRPGTPEGDLSRKVSNRAGLLFALVSLECSVEGGAVDVEHLGEVVEVHAGVE